MAICYLCIMIFPSSLLENAVNEFARLPGIGKKTALRLVLHLIKQDPASVQQFSDTISKMRSEIRFCMTCQNISDGEHCNICSDRTRKRDTICVVENIRDVIAIESTGQYHGTYHVLGGVVSPLDGVGPDQLPIPGLIRRMKEEEVREVIFALSPTIQGDTTIFYIQKQLEPFQLTITTIARGIAFGGELEYADELTLARSLSGRLPVGQYVGRT
jgi:recombination protein RecR